MSKQETYKSHTRGPIPLSFTGRRLLENLRYAITNAIREGAYNHDGEAVSKARGDIALYMSKIEGKTAPDLAAPKLKPTVFFREPAFFSDNVAYLVPVNHPVESFNERVIRTSTIINRSANDCQIETQNTRYLLLF